MLEELNLKSNDNIALYSNIWTRNKPRAPKTKTKNRNLAGGKGVINYSTKIEIKFKRICVRIQHWWLSPIAYNVSISPRRQENRFGGGGIGEVISKHCFRYCKTTEKVNIPLRCICEFSWFWSYPIKVYIEINLLALGVCVCVCMRIVHAATDQQLSFWKCYCSLSKNTLQGLSLYITMSFSTFFIITKTREAEQ